MASEKYLILNNEGQHEYDLIVETLHTYRHEQTKYHLHASQNGIWTEHTKGKLFLTIHDTGNNLIFSKASKTVEYNEVEYIRILMTAINELKPSANKQKFRVIYDKPTFHI
jgi:hypothetical protein